MKGNGGEIEGNGDEIEGLTLLIDTMDQPKEIHHVALVDLLGIPLGALPGFILEVHLGEPGKDRLSSFSSSAATRTTSPWVARAISRKRRGSSGCVYLGPQSFPINLGGRSHTDFQPGTASRRSLPRSFHHPCLRGERVCSRKAARSAGLSRALATRRSAASGFCLFSCNPARTEKGANVSRQLARGRAAAGGEGAAEARAAGDFGRFGGAGNRAGDEN